VCLIVDELTIAINSGKKTAEIRRSDLVLEILMDLAPSDAQLLDNGELVFIAQRCPTANFEAGTEAALTILVLHVHRTYAGAGGGKIGKFTYTQFKTTFILRTAKGLYQNIKW
jgi:hypothetical protein